MKLLSTLADRIVQEVTEILREEVIVVDDNCTIIAASDEKRIGHYHEGADMVIQKKEKLVISPEDAKSLKGVKSGLNLPIILGQRVIGVIGITGTPGKVIHSGQLIQRMTELIIQEAHSSERLDSKYRGLETFVYEWVHLKEIDKEFFERGEILGISMYIPRVCVLLELNVEVLDNAKDQFIEREIIDHLRMLLHDEPQDLVVRWGNGRFVLLKQFNKDDTNKLLRLLQQYSKLILKKFGLQLSIGIGMGETVPNELHRSYQSARKALLVSRKRGNPVFYDELTLDVALSEISEETRKVMVQRSIGSILAEQDLLETLRVYLKCNGSIKDTAEKLHIHINTLHYRIKRIGELTGMSLRDTEDLVTFYLAIAFMNEIK